MKRLLLHICCGPCSVTVLEKLSREHAVTGFFYNPNIQPAEEYAFRRRQLEKLAEILHWDIVYGEYDSARWLAAVRGLETEPEKGRRCTVCFRFRLRAAFAYARDHGFELVASTLSISPYKVTAQINAVGKELEKEFAIPFLAENFKKQDGFQICRRRAAELGVQHQDYCGCLFSWREKEKRREQKNSGDV